MAERNYDNDEQMRDEARKKNSVEPIPHRGETEGLEDSDPEYADKVANALQKKTGFSQDNKEDSQVESDQGSRHGMGNK